MARRRRRAERDRLRRGYYFDGEAAGRAEDFFRLLLRHSKGEWAGKPFELEPWQKRRIIWPLFGWKRRADGLRRYRIAYIEVPRKNGKSTMAAGIGLYLLTADGEPGAEVYSAAGDKDQARIVFSEARNMVLASPQLKRLCQVYRGAVTVEKTGATYRVVSADAPLQEGLNPHGVIFDELHVQRNRELWDTMTKGTAARRQPLTIAITTAGEDRPSICRELHNYALGVIDGTIPDPEFLAVIFAARPDDSWTQRSTWRRANPNLGVTIPLSYLETECRRALRQPSAETPFKRYHLDLWIGQAKSWISLIAWDACDGRPISDEELLRRPCFLGVDLSSTQDFAAAVAYFPHNHALVCRFFIPEETAAKRDRGETNLCSVWARRGLLDLTPGNVIDYDWIRKAIREMAAQFDLRGIAVDPWNAMQFALKLQDEDGFPVTFFRQGFQSMSAPTKEFERLYAGHVLRHQGHPVLRWMASNAVVRTDPAGNVKPDKERSREKIDGIVASIMAIGLSMAGAGAKSVYQERGILSV